MFKKKNHGLSKISVNYVKIKIDIICVLLSYTEWYESCCMICVLLCYTGWYQSGCVDRLFPRIHHVWGIYHYFSFGIVHLHCSLIAMLNTAMAVYHVHFRI